MSDIVLIHPGEQRAVYSDLAGEFTAIEPPVWTRMVAGWLIAKGVTVSIIDQEAERLSCAGVSGVVEALNPKIVAVIAVGHQPSASTQQMKAAGEVCSAIDDARTVVLMGHHASALSERTLREESVDYVCDGEGPLTLLGLLRGDSLDKIPGLVWWYGKESRIIRKNPTGPLIEIDELHGDVWDQLPMQKYRCHNWQAFEHPNRRTPYASIYTTLGCPYMCAFCMINVFQHKNMYRMRTPSQVVDQIGLLHEKYGVCTFKISDEMFVLNKAHVLGVCNELVNRGLGKAVNIWAYARVDTVKEEFLVPLREAGFRWLALGIESASKHVRDGVEKGRFGSEQIIETVRKVQQCGINVIGNYIFGLPDDTHETMQDTLALALEANCEFANFYSAMAYPGSKLYTLALEKGWKLPDSWIGYSQHSWETQPLPTETLTGAEVLAFRDSAFQTYFRAPSYLRMIEQKFGGEVIQNIARMVDQPLPRKLLS